MTISFVVPMNPVGKERPRVSGKNGGVVYTPAKTQAYENFIKGCYVEQFDDFSFKTSSITLDIKSYVPLASRFRKSERAAALKGEIKPDGKPDADNIMKLVLDALNEVAYDDDKYIYRISIEKIYSDKPRTEITISDE